MLTSRVFWAAVAERMIKTFAQATGAAILTTGIASAWDVAWDEALGIGVLSAVLSLLSSLASSAVGPSAGPSLTTEALDDEIGDPGGHPDDEGHDDGVRPDVSAVYPADPPTTVLDPADDPRGQAAPGRRGRHERPDDEGVR